MNTKIKWLSPDEGGRKTLIPITSNGKNDNRYCPIIMIQNVDNTKNTVNWSADIYIQSYTDKYESNAKVSYLSENAPFELLQVGRNFNLYEGNRLVATGQFVSVLFQP